VIHCGNTVLTVSLSENVIIEPTQRLDKQKSKTQ